MVYLISISFIGRFRHYLRLVHDFVCVSKPRVKSVPSNSLICWQAFSRYLRKHLGEYLRSVFRASSEHLQGIFGTSSERLESIFGASSEHLRKRCAFRVFVHRHHQHLTLVSSCQPTTSELPKMPIGPNGACTQVGNATVCVKPSVTPNPPYINGGSISVTIPLGGPKK